MVESRIGTGQFQQSFINNNSTIQGKLFDVQRQIASGVVAETNADISRELSSLNSSEYALRKIDQYIDSNTTTIVRLENANTAVDGIRQLTEDLQNLIINAASSSDAELFIFQQDAEAQLEQVAAFLNTNVEDRYIFAGTKTGESPVTIPVPDNTAVGVPDANYYTGNSVRLTARTGEETSIAYGVTGDHEAFQETIAAYKTAIEAFRTGDNDLMQQASSLVDGAQAKLRGASATISGNINSIERANTFHESNKNFLEVQLSTILDADIAELSTDTALLETQLQALYSVYSTISRLTILDFIR